MELSDRNQHYITALENLLESVPAAQLRDSLEDLFFSFLSEEHVVLPSRDMVHHIYFLLLFLREVE